MRTTFTCNGVSEVWEKLFEEVVSIESVEAFKALLNKTGLERYQI